MYHYRYRNHTLQLSSLLLYTIRWSTGSISVFILGSQHSARCSLRAAQYLLNEQLDIRLKVKDGLKSGHGAGYQLGGDSPRSQQWRQKADLRKMGKTKEDEVADGILWRGT